jgi:isopenicillin N synthase-like dioxygenase
MVGLAVTPIDLEPFRVGGPQEKRRVVAAIDEACRVTGFLQIVGHGIEPAISARMLDVTATFFDQPVELKSTCIVDDLSANRGYASEGTEALSYSLGEEPAAPDLFEAFNAGWDRRSIEPKYLERYRRFYAPNVWPSMPPAMAGVWAEYQAAVALVADDLLVAFALALDVAPTFFIERTRRALVTTRAINYQRRSNSPEPLPGQMRMGAHTDYGILTLLTADDVPGLEVFHDYQWKPVTVPFGWASPEIVEGF